MTSVKRILCGLLILVSSSALAKGETPTSHHFVTAIKGNIEKCSEGGFFVMFTQDRRSCQEKMNQARIEGDTIILWNHYSGKGFACLIDYNPDVHTIKTRFAPLTARGFALIERAINIKYDTCHAIEVLD